jgi:hypothetical protein
MTDYKQLCTELLQAWDNAPTPSDFIDTDGYGVFAKIRAALAEPEPLVERPDRLRVGDVWEFLTELHVNGKQKTIDKLLQWEVKGWNNWEYAWELQSLDGEHRTYLMEFAPSYEEMRFIGTKEHD